MESGRLACVLFVAFIAFVAHSGLSLDEQEADDDKYVNKGDVEKFRRELKVFGSEYGRSWMVIPDDDEISHLAIMDDGIQGRMDGSDETRTYTAEEMPELVLVKSYSPKYPKGKWMKPGNMNSLIFNPSKPTKMICHGWMSSSDSSVISNIRDAYMENQNVNVIGIDWSRIAKDFFYPNAVSATPAVGEYLASIIDSLVEQRKARYSDFHLIGHSLGAHIFGYAGMNTKQKVGRITGLDPALPGFQYLSDDNGRLDSSDAEFVDIIHTCAGILGMSKKIGHVDFFPNGGTPFQPGCGGGVLPTSTQACSHGRSHQLFAESIRHKKFKAIGCSDWEHFKNHKCEKIFTLMGEHTSRGVRGPFYLKTHTNSPFALDLNGTFY